MSNKTADTAVPHITIALCTFNGANHLRAQLDSYLVQRHANWSLWASDDGSSDDTRAILAEFAQRYSDTHPLRIVEGPRQGVAANFMSLLCHPEFPVGLTALSDQDDVWLPEKLEYAVERLRNTSQICLYGAQSIHVDNKLTQVGTSSTRRAVPAFSNALVQNIISGHSAVLSPAFLDLVRRAGMPRDIPYHDWWLYMLATGAGGRVIMDERATLLYRQHDDNLLGAHSGWRASLARARQVMGSTYASWLDANTAALIRCKPLLDPAASTTLDQFSLRPRSLGRMVQHNIKRQGTIGTACLYLAAGLGRI